MRNMANKTNVAGQPGTCPNGPNGGVNGRIIVLNGGIFHVQKSRKLNRHRNLRVDDLELIISQVKNLVPAMSPRKHIENKWIYKKINIQYPKKKRHEFNVPCCSLTRFRHL